MKPIGYWLKHLHNLLEEQFELALDGLSRRDWQVLNTLGSGPQTRDELEQALIPFWEDGQPDLDDVLSRDEWFEEKEDLVSLTEKGREVHAAAAARVGRTRAVVLNGLDREQYEETIRVLSVMASNVEADIAALS
jgi:hypothetical protein